MRICVAERCLPCDNLGADNHGLGTDALFDACVFPNLMELDAPFYLWNLECKLNFTN